MDRFATTDMYEVSHNILGIAPDYDKGTLTITQKDYVQNVLEMLGGWTATPFTRWTIDRSCLSNSQRRSR